MRSSDHSFNIASAKGGLKAKSTSQFRGVVEDDSSSVPFLHDASHYLKNVTVTFVKESFSEVRERGGNIPQVDDDDLVSLDVVSQALEEVAHGSGAFKPAAAAEFHLDGGGVVGQFEHSLVRCLSSDQVRDSSEDFFGWRVVRMESQNHAKLLSGRDNSVEEVLHVGPEFFFGVSTSEDIRLGFENISVAVAAESISSDFVKTSLESTSRLPGKNSDADTRLLEDVQEVLEFLDHRISVFSS